MNENKYEVSQEYLNFKTIVFACLSSVSENFKPNETFYKKIVNLIHVMENYCPVTDKEETEHCFNLGKLYGILYGIKAHKVDNEYYSILNELVKKYGR